MEPFLEKIKKSELDFALVKKAYDFAKKAHTGQKRVTGDEYFKHPVSVANRLLELDVDTDTIVAALLHDTVEDTTITLADIKKNFNDDVVMLVDALTKIEAAEENSINVTLTHKKILAYGEKDKRVFLIKLADVVDNLSDIEVLGKPKASTYSRACLVFYLPIAQKFKLKDFARDIERYANMHA
ncbi:bifunctional (p)ppGpp synthetase/guanosine-3',5'-bis(diphosphate) 3'-pyrophosphohydrolase [Candidatus Woesearchaeota archaeon]|nr:MAG: bifunctional (p)ppGpp synthetase/guanosine-3',5'-bis(diphosphate) 3'-pyrophosphohydrolase [Candidatus Woesearchaeota archaeon]